MPRISIDVTPEQHAEIKTNAALSGQTIKQYLLGGFFGDAAAADDRPLALPNGQVTSGEGDDWSGLDQLLANRLSQVENREFVDFDPADMMRRALERYEAKQKAAA